ncbi:MAG TPA: glycosyltransferase [Anaeromyxobacter sp.]|nr:glycosyltransferase [Anaeromyxobacter sp.]
MRVAFVGHPHHAKTGSARFMLDALRRLANVDEHVAGPAPGRPRADLAAVVHGRHDAVVVWQVEWAALRLVEAGLPNVTFFPMYDSCRDHPDSFWRRLAPSKVVSFSSVLAGRLQRLGVRVRHARYWPEVPPERVSPGPELAGYFWRRSREVSWETIRTLIGRTPFRRFTLHDAPDPGEAPLPAPPPDEAARVHLRRTEWHADRADARADLLAHDVYFAPRLHEGIGMSFLEAMALGFLVVAPDRPTMNEYVVSGVNGLLYDPDAPAPLDLGRARELGTRARQSVAAGREQWCRELPALLDFVATPARAAEIRAPLFSVAAPPAGARRAAPRAPAAAVAPRVSVIVAGDAPLEGVEATLASVDAQEGLPLERTVLAGGALAPALAAARGAYLQLLSPGEVLPSSDALAAALRGAPAEVDLVVGHTVLRDALGCEELRPAADPAAAYAALRRGALGWTWIERLPTSGAILWRRDLLLAVGVDLSAPLAWEDALLRAVGAGARVHHALRVLAVRPTRPHAVRTRRAALRAWRALAVRHTERPGPVEDTFARMELEAAYRELDGVRALDLLLSLPRVPGAFRALKRRVRTRRALG